MYVSISHKNTYSPHTHYIEIFHIPFIALQILLVFNNMVLNKKEGSGVRLPGFKFCLYKLCNYVNLSKLLNLLKPLFGNPQMRITIQSTSKGDVKIKWKKQPKKTPKNKKHSSLVVQRVKRCHCSGLGCCCGAGLIPGMGTFTRHGHSQKKEERKEKTSLCLTHISAQKH